jgi:hypothetical protein
MDPTSPSWGVSTLRKLGMHSRRQEGAMDVSSNPNFEREVLITSLAADSISGIIWAIQNPPTFVVPVLIHCVAAAPFS